MTKQKSGCTLYEYRDSEKTSEALNASPFLYMDIQSAAIIGFLAGYIIFKEIMWHKHLDKLEEKLLAKDLTDYKTSVKDFNPPDKKVTMAEQDTVVPLEDVPSPYLPPVTVKDNRNVAIEPKG